MAEAVKFLTPLLTLAPHDIQTHLWAARVYMRKSMSVNRAHHLRPPQLLLMAWSVVCREIPACAARTQGSAGH